MQGFSAFSAFSLALYHLLIPLKTLCLKGFEFIQQALNILNLELLPDNAFIAGKQRATDADTSSGYRMSQDANAASRKATGIHNGADRANA